MEKPEAQVYDATAGNRVFYIEKDHPLILYDDIEPDLSFKPDAILDCRNTGLPDKSKHLIIFDPPHDFGRTKNQGMYATPSKEVYDDKWPQWKRPNALPRYYGIDKYKTKKELKNFIYDAQKEFYRILSDGGALFFKWSENRVTLHDILKLFRNWSIILQIRAHQTGNMATPTYWIMFMKSPTPNPQTELEESINSKSKRSLHE